MSVARANTTLPARERTGTIAHGARRHASPELFLLANATLAACALAAGTAWLPGPLRMMGAALLVLVLPGAAWLGLFRKSRLDAPRLALAVIGLSSLSAIGGLVVLALGPEPPSRMLLMAWTAVVMNAGLLVAGVPSPLDPRVPWRRLVAVAACGFLATSAAALWLVPPLEDHDMEVRGTAYGLATTLKPYFLTNREVYLPFAHPILFHVHVAESLVMTGEIGATKPSYDSARRAEALTLEGKPVPWMDWWWADYRAFVENPAKAGTRAPSALFAALVLALLADLVRRLTGSWAAGLAAAALYATVPEIVVRSAYAGYFSQTVFAMLVAACLFDGGDHGGTVPSARDAAAEGRGGGAAAERRRGGLSGDEPVAECPGLPTSTPGDESSTLSRPRSPLSRAPGAGTGEGTSWLRVRGRDVGTLWAEASSPFRADLVWLAAAGAFAALVDHKTVVLVLGVAGLASVRLLVEGWRMSRRLAGGKVAGGRFDPGTLLAALDVRAIALGTGFTAATLVWWIYGFSVDHAVFVRDHLRMHIAHRILLNDVRLAHDANRYAPSIAELWMQFWAHTGYFLLPVALAGIAVWLFTRGADDRRAVLAAWCLCGAVLYTLTDWRQTKHLMNGLAPMTAAAVCLAWPRRGGGRPPYQGERWDGPPPRELDGRGMENKREKPENGRQAPEYGERSEHGRRTAEHGREQWGNPGEPERGDGPPPPKLGTERPEGADTIRSAWGPGVEISAHAAWSSRESSLEPREIRPDDRPVAARRGAAFARTLAALALAAAALVNLTADVRLVQDFGSLKVSGASDVDGW